MITMAQFAHNAAALASTVTEYVWGATGGNGKCDCVGLVIGALRDGGVKWDGINGTNYTARKEMRYLTPLESADKLQTGMVVLKSRAPGQNGYALPDKYKQGTDLNDYYHIGVVTSVEPLEITHCTSPGPIKRDRVVSGWHWYGELEKVGPDEQTGESVTMTPMVVTGGRLALRNGPGKGYQTVMYIPNGAPVLAEAESTGDWVQTSYNGKSGYCMREYLILPQNAVQDSGEYVSLPLDKAVAETLLRALQSALK